MNRITTSITFIYLLYFCYNCPNMAVFWLVMAGLIMSREYVK